MIKKALKQTKINDRLKAQPQKLLTNNSQLKSSMKMMCHDICMKITIYNPPKSWLLCLR